jgi:glycine cleavage system aminomethyltransferase T
VGQSQQARHGPLHAVHVAAGARMVDFAGWSMPVQYSGVIAEHLAVTWARRSWRDPGPSSFSRS